MLPDTHPSAISPSDLSLSDRSSNDPSNAALVEAFRGWLKRKFPHTSTPIHYASDAKLFFAWLNQPALATRVADIDAYIQHCQANGHHAATINRRLATLRVFFDWLSFELDEHRPPVPSPVVPRRHFVRVGERLPRDVRDADVATLFSTIASARDRAMFVLMLRCGLRVGEIRALSLQDIHVSSQARHSLPRLRVHGKGDKERTAYLSSQAQAALHAWLVVRPHVQSDAVFINRRGQRLSVNGIQYILGRVCERAGLHITCHQFRHTFGRHMAEARVPVTSIQRLMGHHWLQSTEVYLHLSDPYVQADYDTAMQSIGPQLDILAQPSTQTQVGGAA
jgi:site-specific recombinase XerD